MDQIENILNQFSDNTNLKRYLNSLENLTEKKNKKNMRKYIYQSYKMKKSNQLLF